MTLFRIWPNFKQVYLVIYVVNHLKTMKARKCISKKCIAVTETTMDLDSRVVTIAPNKTKVTCADLLKFDCD